MEIRTERRPHDFRQARVLFPGAGHECGEDLIIEPKQHLVVATPPGRPPALVGEHVLLGRSAVGGLRCRAYTPEVFFRRRREPPSARDSRVLAMSVSVTPSMSGRHQSPLPISGKSVSRRRFVISLMNRSKSSGYNWLTPRMALTTLSRPAPISANPTEASCRNSSKSTVS